MLLASHAALGVWAHYEIYRGDVYLGSRREYLKYAIQVLKMANSYLSVCIRYYCPQLSFWRATLPLFTLPRPKKKNYIGRETGISETGLKRKTASPEGKRPGSAEFCR